MFNWMTVIVLILSGIYEGFRGVQCLNTMNVLRGELANQVEGTVIYNYLSNSISNATIELVICGVLLLLTVICLLRYIRFAIFGAMMMFGNGSSDIVKTTNSDRH